MSCMHGFEIQIGSYGQTELTKNRSSIRFFQTNKNRKFKICSEQLEPRSDLTVYKTGHSFTGWIIAKKKAFLKISGGGPSVVTTGSPDLIFRSAKSSTIIRSCSTISGSYC